MKKNLKNYRINLKKKKLMIKLNNNNSLNLLIFLFLYLFFNSNNHLSLLHLTHRSMRNYLSNKHNQEIDPIWFVLQPHCKGLSKDNSRYSVQ